MHFVAGDKSLSDNVSFSPSDTTVFHVRFPFEASITLRKPLRNNPENNVTRSMILLSPSDSGVMNARLGQRAFLNINKYEPTNQTFPDYSLDGRNWRQIY